MPELNPESRPQPPADNKPSPPPGLKAASPKDARERILEEAKKLFRQKGFEGVSLNDIVNAVGVKKPTIYYYFGDKEGLFVEVLMAMMRYGHNYVTANIRPEMTLTQKLTHLSEGYLRFSPTSLLSMLRDAQNYLSPASQQQVIAASQRHLVDPFEQLFQEGIDAQEIQPLDPKSLAMLYLSLIDSMTLQKSMLEGRNFDYQATAKLLVNTLFYGISTTPKANE